MGNVRDITKSYWDAVSAMDADEVVSGFAEHALFCFGNTPARRGRANIRRSFVQLFARTAHIGCQPVAAWRSDTCVVADVDLTIVFDDGRSLTIPTTTTFRIAGQRIQECRVHFHPEPALEPPGSGLGWSRQMASLPGQGR